MRPVRALAAGAAILLAACAPTHRPAEPVLTTAAPATTTTSAAPTTTTTLPTRLAPAISVSRHLVRPRPDLTDDIRSRVIAAIYAYSDWDPARMVRVASCESGLNPWAVNGSHHGFLQIKNATLGLIEEHAALGHQIWLRWGYGAWQCKG